MIVKNLQQTQTGINLKSKQKQTVSQIANFSTKGILKFINQDLYHPVFDGNKGEFCSKFLKNNIEMILKASIKDKEKVNKNKQMTNWETRMMYAFENAFLDLNQQLKNKNVNCGSTGLVLLIQKESGKAIISSVGDSIYSIKYINGNIKDVESHNFKNIIEQRRINLMENCTLEYGRLSKNGMNISLEPTRVFGDFEMEGCVLCIPEFEIFEITNVQSIAISSDGFSLSQIHHFLNFKDIGKYDTLKESIQNEAITNRDDSTIILLKIKNNF